MVNKLFCFIGAATLAILPMPVSAASFKSGNELYAACRTEKSDRFYEYEFVTCMAYITGVFDTYSVSFTMGAMNASFCNPPGVTVTQLRDIAVRYLETNPQRRDLPASMLVMIAFREAFPCNSAVSK